MSGRPILPDDTEEIAGYSHEELRPWNTIQRATDGTIYLVGWWYGTTKVRCVIYPDGRVWVDDEGKP